ncbi:hypothetical protein Hypma_004706 [Hypsizygus marmoreus]|uniref:Fungal-type protein kinase domain-containing protein n=1 Tax=Hypsizygus marmoreus TaxID=39966 RepID=A0A369IZN9_HYPMA|nr:hypothetical protein Hypma_004706 [Hypsizygus marmoreus]
MANLIRSAKPSSKWSTIELYAFNITIESPSLPPPPVTVSDVILNNEELPEDNANCTKADRQFFYLMGDATMPGEESFVEDFLVFLLDLVDYNCGTRVVHTRCELEFNMCGETVDAKPDVGVFDGPGISGTCVLLAKVDKSGTISEAMLIAEAIAAFTDACRIARSIGRPAPRMKTVAGIIMDRTTPAYYKIPITEELIYEVMAGQYPQTRTVVQRFTPVSPSSKSGYVRGV